MSFDSLSLLPQLLKAVSAEGYTTPTPIQTQSIPHVLAGRDLLGCAQTGTGKTAAFALPILQLLTQKPRKSNQRTDIRVLVLSPTRELATQIGESFRVYGKHLSHRSAVIFGGVGHEPQRRALRSGVDILIATPGRLLDLMNERNARLGALEILVLDEADRMLDMGFIHDVRRILKAVPRERQTLFFSATMPRDIQELAGDILTNPARVEVAPQATTAEKVDQKIYFVAKNDKRALLTHLLNDPGIERALIFTRTKHGADKVVRYLSEDRIPAQAIHGNKSQGQRERALGAFKTGRSRVLVATDIAARGIDVEGISHVINYDLPNIPESYVHRIGRTARAGASGHAISFCDSEERAYLRDIERTTRQRIPVEMGHPFAGRQQESTEATRAPGHTAQRSEQRRPAQHAPAQDRHPRPHAGQHPSQGGGRRDEHPRQAQGQGRRQEPQRGYNSPRGQGSGYGPPRSGQRPHGRPQGYASRPQGPSQDDSRFNRREERPPQQQATAQQHPPPARPAEESFGNTIEGSLSNDYGRSIAAEGGSRLERDNSKYRW